MLQLMTAVSTSSLEGSSLEGSSLEDTSREGTPDPRPEPSRRSRKKSRTHAALAEAADVSQRTLFRHFSSKEAVLYGDMDELILELRDALARPEIIAGATMSAVRVATRQWTVSRGAEDYMALISAALSSVKALGDLAA